MIRLNRAFLVCLAALAIPSCGPQSQEGGGPGELGAAIAVQPGSGIPDVADGAAGPETGVQSALVQSCTTGDECGSGFCVDGVCCDDACGDGATDDCLACSVDAGAEEDGHCGTVAAGFACRLAAGPCDRDEVCDGTSTECPEDAKVPAGTACAAADAPCDLADACDGVSAACPDAVKAAGVVCRSTVAGTCDVTDRCDGVSHACVDAFKAAGTTCRSSGGTCDLAEKCTGTSPQCPADVVKAAGTVCRSSGGGCDVVETCDGAAKACPADAIKPAGAACRLAAGPCDAVETCDGSTKACPANAYLASGTVCREAAGPCDVADKCSGTSASCVDRFASSSTVCRAAAGPCDKADKCTGKAAACPADAFLAATTVCRPSAGVCDVAEKCSGTAADCPSDAMTAQGTVCRASVGPCDASEMCDGATAACPANAYVAAGTVCRQPAGPCDKQDTCSGTSASCTDTFLPSSTPCRPSAGPCDAVEYCPGNAAACRADAFLPATALCRAAAGACDVADYCTGLAAACPADAVKGAGTVCRSVSGACDLAETCDGVAAACPANAYMPKGIVCRDVGGDCDVAESCTGLSWSCPTDRFKASTVVCRPSQGQCDSTEKCTGAAAACPADLAVADGTSCDDGDACTPTDGCQAGQCVGADTVTCAPLDGCHDAGTCNPATGTCSNPEKPTGGPCDTGVPGVCAAGTVACVDGGIECVGSQSASPETCNGLDDDCDGTADEENPGGGMACDTGLPGVCAAGTIRCDGGALSCRQDQQATWETCNGLDDDCDGLVDPWNPGGGVACDTGLPGICAVGRTDCRGGSIECDQIVLPGVEECDGEDDDCDGVVDNGNPGGGVACDTGMAGACAEGLTACSGGAIVCVPTQSVTEEVCNGEDDDCDGAVDDGNPGSGVACDTGLPGACAAGTTACTGGQLVCVQDRPASAETCNGLDDDCDGLADGGNPGGGFACSTGLQGACAAGTTACANGAVVCVQDRQAAAETCDGLDNDCDGVVDEGNPGGGVACDTGLPGACAAGTTACANGAVACVQDRQAAAETCDGLDNDCDGVVDEGNPGGGLACSTGLPGVCAAGTTACANGAVVCAQDVPSAAETCNGLDDDCDGEVDEGVEELGAACLTGLPGVCGTGTIACAGGAPECVQDVQPSGETCNLLDDDCNGVVDDLVQGAWMLCHTGLPGECSFGWQTCIDGVLECLQIFPSVPEVCNGKDDDCDGAYDEGDPGGGLACNTGVPGVCAAGTTYCQNSEVRCRQTTEPTPETCNGLDDDCDGTVDEGSPGSGVPCATGLMGVCGVGSTACREGALACDQTAFPAVETCNGLDDDCDGVVDEGNPGGGGGCYTGLPGVCASGTLTCTGGTVVCRQDIAATAETCNGLDDDCDGVPDNGGPGAGVPCVTGLLGACAAGTTACRNGELSCQQDVPLSVETCNGLDDDCDGTVDDGNPGGGVSCSTGFQGICAPGTTACRAGALACDQDVPAGVETCNGLDDDCDGDVDEGSPGVGVMCNTGIVGVCWIGTTACTPSGSIVCVQNVQPSAETCNGLDDDCDGVVDDGDPGAGVACATGLPGICAAGTTVCSSGSILCVQNQAATAETCDGLDNDCDGDVDEGIQGIGMACVTGLQGVCSFGKTECTAQGTIVCVATTAPSAETCNGLDDDCDGTADEGNPGGGVACDTGLLGACGQGLTSCSSGSITCVQTVTPKAETCNDVDDDCDGTKDENPSCDEKCPARLNSTLTCGPGGSCAYVCQGVWVDCNGDMSDGCELMTGSICHYPTPDDEPFAGPEGVVDCIDGALVCITG